MSHALSSLLKQISLQYLPHTCFSPSTLTLSRSTSAPSLLPDSGEDVAQLRVAQSKRKAHTTSKAAKLWTTGPPPHTSRTGKARKKESKSLLTETESLSLLAQWAVTDFESKLYLHIVSLQLHACAVCAHRGPTPWALTACNSLAKMCSYS